MQDDLRLAIYDDEQTSAAIQELFGYQSLLDVMKAFLAAPLFDLMLREKEHVHSIPDFQEKIVLPLLNEIEQESITQLTASGFEHLDPKEQYLFISNHRDIILDSAFLNKVLFEKGFRTSQIAIGDNLMRHRISELIFRANKSFVVQRSGSPIELYRSSVLLSEYIRQQIAEKTDSVWIAQREGRAKDGDDRTQVGLLKMLSLSATGDLKTHFRNLKVVPVAISYEYDPCDLLKAQEFLNKRADPDFKKTFEEDTQHMLLGLKGQKGAVHFHFSKPLDAELDVFDTVSGTKKQLELLAGIIDRHIHRNYQIRPVNYVAFDLLMPGDTFSGQYSPEARSELTAYFESRFARLKNDEEGLGRQYLLKMYANPLINFTVQMEAATER